MGKWVLAIIAVASLHVGFVAYTSKNGAADPAEVALIRNTNAPLPDLGPASRPIDAAISTHTIAVIDEAETAPESKEPVVHTAFNRPTRNTAAVNRPFLKENLIARAPVRRLTESSPVRPRWETKVITYPAKLVIEPQTMQMDLVAKRADKADKRSLIAGVFKKPWSWIKALGSKLK
jgi:hypothetical protein